MKVILDTNVLCQDYHRVGSAFQVFEEGLAVIPATLCVPEVVVDESANRLREDLEDALRAAQKELKRLNRLADESLQAVKLRLDVSQQEKAYRAGLVEWIKRVGGVVLPYPKIDHKKVVQRDLGRQKPFRQSGAGYRDYLIWESVRRATIIEEERVIFVTGNKKDFGEGPRVHPDLEGEVTSRRLQLVRSLSRFNEEHILPRLSMLGDVKTSLQENRVSGFELSSWVNEGLLEGLRDEQLGMVVAGFPPNIGSVHAQRLSELKSVAIDEVRLLESGRHLIRLEVRVEVVVRISLSWDDYLNHSEVQEWAGPSDGGFESLWARMAQELNVEAELVFDPATKAIESQEILRLGGDYGSISMM